MIPHAPQPHLLTVGAATRRLAANQRPWLAQRVGPAYEPNEVRLHYHAATGAYRVICQREDGVAAGQVTVAELGTAVAIFNRCLVEWVDGLPAYRQQEATIGMRSPNHCLVVRR